MPTFDETDMEILRLLVADGRRPYSDIADAVGLSPPTVSDRIDRLREAGVIEQFTVDVDRTQLSGGLSVLVAVSFEPDAVERGRSNLIAHDDVEHAFTAADGTVFVNAFVEGGDVRAFLADAVDLDDVSDYEVHLLTDAAWTPGLGHDAFDLDCAECGNTVTDEGETERIEGTTYHFCCSSCRAQFREQYETIREAAE